MSERHETATLFRPTGPEELALVAESGFKRCPPPRLPGQPIFYPVTNQQIAGDPLRAHAFWFSVCGLLAALLSVVVDGCERSTGRVPSSLGWRLGGIALLVVIAMPASGAWLIFMPAVGAVMHTARTESAQG